MAESSSLGSAQVQFLDDRLALIHLPLDIYTVFLEPILKLLFYDVPSLDEDEGVEDESDTERHDDTSTSKKPAFINFSVTPIECSVACSRDLANKFFVPLAEKLNACSAAPDGDKVLISKEDYTVMQVEGQGLDACRRVLELTSPLAMAGISIFFISTYFSDYILFPMRARGRVIQALENRGFTFEATAGAFINSSSGPSRRSSPLGLEPTRIPGPDSMPSTISELQSRTFESLRKHNVQAYVDESLRIVQCAAHYREPSNMASPSGLRPGVITALMQDNPKFLSLTMTSTDPAASILLETRLLPRFAQRDPTDTLGLHSNENEEQNNLLIGAKDDVLMPIMFDLRNLPLEATGIICGVASRLAAATQNRDNPEPNDTANEDTEEHDGQQYRLPTTGSKEPVEMSFLSTTLGGTCIVGIPELERAMQSLRAEAESASLNASNDQEEEVSLDGALDD